MQCLSKMQLFVPLFNQLHCYVEGRLKQANCH